MNEERLKIAVFIDFDNIEIGVKTTLSRRFDVGTVLEAVKERGEVVTKIAYGNWKMAEDYSRAMTEHAVQMVQRNVTPGGDKNGADINLALDALEMAFTRNHINAFVIVGGDSDFIALVEKLKQYDKKVIIVGGRAFTSAILQKNCHEFLAYENLIGAQPGSRKSGGGRPMGRVQLETALPLVRRALKILADREVSPQLGLLKSTLLQLDSTFSERDYGVGSFRDFIQRMAGAGHVTLKQVDRSLIVESRDGESRDSDSRDAGGAVVPDSAPEPESPSREETGGSPADAFRPIVRLFRGAKAAPHWPMYLRNLRQYFRAIDPSFDERKMGFSSFNDLLRQGQREGVFRVERNRQGVIRIFAGDRFPHRDAAGLPADGPSEDGIAPEPTSEAVSADTPIPEPVGEIPPLLETSESDSRKSGATGDVGETTPTPWEEQGIQHDRRNVEPESEIPKPGEPAESTPRRRPRARSRVTATKKAATPRKPRTSKRAVKQALPFEE